MEAYVDGELSPNATARVRVHISECPDCEGHAALVAEVRQALRRRTVLATSLVEARLRRFLLQLTQREPR